MVNEIVFQVIFVIVFIAFWLVRFFYIRKTRNPSRRRSRKERRDALRKEGWTGLALVVLTPIEIFLIILYLWNPLWMQWAILDFPEYARLIGLTLLIVSIPLAIWVHETLGKHYSYALEIKEEQRIIDQGPYSRVRHPLYTTHNIFNLGMILLTANIPLILFAIIGVPLTYARMKSEETMMMLQFGEDYTRYMLRTGRIFPKIRQTSLEPIDT